MNKSCSINFVLEKRNFKFIWTLIISQNQLYNHIVKYSLYNCTTIIGEHVRYFMNKYDISRDDWNSPTCILYIHSSFSYSQWYTLVQNVSHNIVYNTIDLYSTQHTTIYYDDCVASSFRELCESLASECTHFFDRNESCKLIEIL